MFEHRESDENNPARVLREGRAVSSGFFLYPGGVVGSDCEGAGTSGALLAETGSGGGCDNWEGGEGPGSDGVTEEGLAISQKADPEKDRRRHVVGGTDGRTRTSRRPSRHCRHSGGRKAAWPFVFHTRKSILTSNVAVMRFEHVFL